MILNSSDLQLNRVVFIELNVFGCLHKNEIREKIHINDLKKI